MGYGCRYGYDYSYNYRYSNGYYGFSYSKPVVLYTPFLLVVESLFVNILDSAAAILCQFKLS